MFAGEQILQLIEGGSTFRAFQKEYKSRTTVGLNRLAGSAFAVYAAALIHRCGGIHVIVMPDRDAAAYLSSDLSALLDESSVMFFPTGYKRSIRFGKQDESGIVQRTAAMNAVASFKRGYIVLCTYPEAVAEKVAARKGLSDSTITIKTGAKVSMTTLEQRLVDADFERVSFVYEPGQYSIRGGIMDVFSYSKSRPYRLDFFGDEVDSIRFFDISTQLTVEKVERAVLVPRLTENSTAVSIAEFVGQATYWVDDMDALCTKLDGVRIKLLGEMESPERINDYVTSAQAFVNDTADCRMLLRSDTSRRTPEAKLDFQTSPQPKFNKQFDMLGSNIADGRAEGCRTFILSGNKAQIERLHNIFAQLHIEAPFDSLDVTLHEGFIDTTLRVQFYTDHQIFERYHRYQLRGEIQHDESLTVQELNELKIGDYVVHIDHGVGVFGGMVQSIENGRTVDAVKLVYKDGDTLFVNIHNLHKIARYKSADGVAPRIYKLGSASWQRLKAATKTAVKNIARELIALYAKRKAEGGYAFSTDNYLMHELEASFRYEETPDQRRAVEAVKHDMEASEPMDRLICGDVGFGKTEVAVRAAFKAVCDSKQVAILVPTTILALQHYRTFSERMRGLPVKIEQLSRGRSASEVKNIVSELKDGKIDIVVGTHKLLGKSIEFRDLGLLIIDEEQKFGVSSKERLRQLKASVDTLTLTATPIPRTLQFSLMGSRDLSIINTPPPNRQPIATESHVWSPEIIEEAVSTELARGGQVYFVHNRVENIDHIAAQIRELCPAARVVVCHGQMPSEKVEGLLMDFVYGEYDVLVATSIIENGIDIPNANTIIINNAQNFGLSDLHQLRGRVGRSDRKAFCYLLSPPDELLTDDAKRRLRAIEEFSDLGSGFNIAMQDLDIRGAGNLFGAEQSGFIANIGFETYRKILAEAVAELRSEGIEGADRIIGTETDTPRYVDDCFIETDTDASLPDEYIGQSAEKLRLYRVLDSLQTEDELQRFELEMEDRFGEMPASVRELMNVVRVRKLCIGLGFEHAKIKNGLMILRFVGDNTSPYFKSATFNGILQYIMPKKEKFVLRQNNNKLGLLVRSIADCAEAFRELAAIKAFVEQIPVA